MRASFLWHIASSFANYKGPLREITTRLGNFLGDQGPREKITREQFEMECDNLLLFGDPTIRVMVLNAMFLAHYHNTKHIGLIASLVYSEEWGEQLWEDGKCIGKERVGSPARIYLLHALDLRETDVFSTLQRKIRHWIDCLESESQTKESHNQTLAWANEDVGSYLNQIFTTNFVAERRKEVQTNLRRILEYAFSTEESHERVGNILSLLGDLAMGGYFPEAWLIKIAEETIQNPACRPRMKTIKI